MHLFLVCLKVFEAPWKSGPAKTGPAEPVPPPLAGGREYRKIVHIDDTYDLAFDAYRAPAMVWANESIQPIVRLLIVGLSGLSFSGIFSLVTGVVSIYCSSLN